MGNSPLFQPFSILLSDDSYEYLVLCDKYYKTLHVAL